jgi:hypothetical protein
LSSESKASSSSRFLSGLSKEQLVTVLLAVLMAIIAVAWLEPWVMWATRNTDPARATPLVSPLLMIVIVLAGALVTRLAAKHAVTWRQMAGRVVFGSIIAMVLAEVLALGLRPPLEIVQGLVLWNGFFSPEVVVLITAAILWLRGILIGRSDVMREDIEGMFYTGVLALVVLLLFDAVRPAVPFGDLFWSALVFFVASLLALALVGPEHAHFWQRETSMVRLVLNRYWLITIAFMIGLIVFVGLIISSAAGPEALGILRSIAMVGITALIYVAQAVLTVVVYIIVLLLSPLIPLFQQLGPMIGEIMKRVQPNTLGPNDPASQAAQSALNGEALAALVRGLAVLAVLMIFLLFFLLVLIRLGFISSRRSDETRDSIASRQLLKDQLKHWLARQRTRSAEAPYLALAGDDPRSAVRRAYQIMLQWAAARVGERAPYQTPSAYADRIARAIPGQREDLHTLTALYLRARYAVDPMGPDEAHAAQSALVRLQETPVIQSPLIEE